RCAEHSPLAQLSGIGMLLLAIRPRTCGDAKAGLATENATAATKPAKTDTAICLVVGINRSPSPDGRAMDSGDREGAWMRKLTSRGAPRRPKPPPARGFLSTRVAPVRRGVNGTNL